MNPAPIFLLNFLRDLKVFLNKTFNDFMNQLLCRSIGEGLPYICFNKEINYEGNRC